MKDIMRPAPLAKLIQFTLKSHFFKDLEKAFPPNIHLEPSISDCLKSLMHLSYVELQSGLTPEALERVREKRNDIHCEFLKCISLIAIANPGVADRCTDIMEDMLQEVSELQEKSLS